MAEQYALVANISHYSKLLYILGARIPISQAKKLRLRRGSSLLGHTQLARGAARISPSCLWLHGLLPLFSAPSRC